MGCVDRARHCLRFATKWIQPMRKIAESICKVSRARVRWARTSRPAARRQCLPNGSDNANTPRIVKREEASQVSRLIFDFSCSSTNGWLVNIWLMLHLTSTPESMCVRGGKRLLMRRRECCTEQESTREWLPFPFICFPQLCVRYFWNRWNISRHVCCKQIWAMRISFRGFFNQKLNQVLLQMW